MPERPAFPTISGRRIVICDYNALLLSVTGLLRMTGYVVFQANDGRAAQELCLLLPDIELLVLNTYRTGIDVGELCETVRVSKPGMAILHIGSTTPTVCRTMRRPLPKTSPLLVSCPRYRAYWPDPKP